MQAIHQTPAASAGMKSEAERINTELENIMFIFNGPQAKASQEELPPASHAAWRQVKRNGICKLWNQRRHIYYCQRNSLKYLKMNSLLSWQESGKPVRIF